MQVFGKLRPDRDLQCYFERPSSIAALSEASESGFTVSGTWRQQFDWAVVEWNRDNVIEHPVFRNLPDGDLSGLTLTYEEERENCIPLDSDIYPTVDWPYLRIWATVNGAEDVYRVSLKNHATAVGGGYQPAFADLQLLGSITVGDYIGISFLSEHFTYRVTAGDTIQSTVQAVVDSVNTFSRTLVATRAGNSIRLVYVGEGQSLESSTVGQNGNRLGVYGFVSGTGTETWFPKAAGFSGGQSPTRWRINLSLGSLKDVLGRDVPTGNIRKMRWTYAADLQESSYERSEFRVRIFNWTVTGSNRGYMVAGAASRRIEDSDTLIVYGGSWQSGSGNFSGGTIRYSTVSGSTVRIKYSCSGAHKLFIGSRYAFNGTNATIQIDGVPSSHSLLIPGEDTLCRIPMGEVGPGEHIVQITHTGASGSYLYFDYIDIVIPSDELPDFEVNPNLTLATDWDTDHSLAIAPERSAWLIHQLGFRARQNHYVGALWFYELVCTGNVYASTTVRFVGTPVFSETVTLRVGRVGETSTIDISHVNRIGDTAETVAIAFAFELNRGYTGIRGEAHGDTLTIFSRAIGTAGNQVTISAVPSPGPFQVEVASPTLAGGVDGIWHTDLTATPRINRACRDWSRSFYKALLAYGIDVTAAFSLELQHGDDSLRAGIAQRYPNGDAAWLNTPALQTNFSPESLMFWREVYRDMATVMQDAGVQPYLQFGEVQWWYFPKDGSGMPLYDDYTKTQFRARYGREMKTIASNAVDPVTYAEEAEFLPTLIGNFTNAVIAFVKNEFSNCRFEVLYPTDVNNTPLNRLINFPAAAWTPEVLDCLKTESFTFTFERNLDHSRITITYPESRGFPISKRSFLVGINDPTTPWSKELEMSQAEGHPSSVLFALDQFCLVGYMPPVKSTVRRSFQSG
ncbi:MAG: hypothetical protein IT168_02575 [Bryobacterales bacterium]|nr:hypothetical protein [Bryobacterales bacterium]